MNFSSSCLSQLESLDLSDNFLTEIPVQWISQMSVLKRIYLSNNELTCIPYTMFYNISNLEILDVSSNNLTSFEFWLIQIQNLINYTNNPVTRFTNDFNVDLSHYQSNMTVQILLNDTRSEIDFDDGIFEMYNRCGEVNSTYQKTLTQAVGIIHQTTPGLLHWRCSCEQYYLQEYIVSINPANNFSTWRCSFDSNGTIYREKCSNQSALNVTNIKPRLCKINQSEPGVTPEYVEINACNSVSRY